MLQNSTGGSNPSLSAIFLFRHFPRHPPTRAGIGCATPDRFLSRASERFLRRGLRRSNPAAGSGGTGPRDRRRTKTIHFAGDFRDSGRPSVRQSRREARGSAGATLPNRLANRIRRAAGPPAALHFPPPGARNRFWRLVTSPRHRLRAGQTAYKPASKNKSLILQRKARAIRTSVSTVGFCSPRSIRPTKFLWQSTFSANSSWDSPKARRRTRTAAPNFRHSLGIGLFMLARTSEWYILLYTREMYIPRRGGP